MKKLMACACIWTTLTAAGCGGIQSGPEPTSQEQALTATPATAAVGNASPPSSEFRSGSRLRARVTITRGADGSMGRNLIGWYDAQRKEECEFMAASDGTSRCMPSVVDYVEAYRDASCTAPYVRVPEGAPKPNYVQLEMTASTAKPSDEVAGSEEFIHRIAHIGVEIPEPKLTYVHEGDKCVKQEPIDLSGGEADAPTSPSGKIYTVGAELAPSEFVAGKVETITE